MSRELLSRIRHRSDEYIVGGECSARKQAKTAAGIWAIPWPSGGKPELVLRFDDPVRQPYRPYWMLSRERLFVLLQESESDVWVVDSRGM